MFTRISTWPSLFGNGNYWVAAPEKWGLRAVVAAHGSLTNLRFIGQCHALKHCHRPVFLPSSSPSPSKSPIRGAATPAEWAAAGDFVDGICQAHHSKGLISINCTEY